MNAQLEPGIPDKPKFGDIIDQVREQFARDPAREFTIDEIALSAGLPRHKAATAIYNMALKGRLEALGPLRQRRYRWIGGEQQLVKRVEQGAGIGAKTIARQLEHLAQALKKLAADVEATQKRIEVQRRNELMDNDKLREENELLRKSLKDLAGKL